MNKVLLFGNKQKCIHCIALIQLIKKQGINIQAQSFKYIDAFADQNQQFCDQHNVDEIPHVKIYKDDKLWFQDLGQKINYKNTVSKIKQAI